MKTTEKTRDSNRPKHPGGRPKGRKNAATLERELRELRAQLKAQASPPGSTTSAAVAESTPAAAPETPPAPAAADPFADVPRDVAEAAQPPPAGAAPAADPAGAPVADASTKHPLGEQRAGELLSMIYMVYDGVIPGVLGRLIGQRIEREFTGKSDPEKKLIFDACVEVARMKDQEEHRKMLDPPLIRRLAEIEVSDDFDLWSALLMVVLAKAAVIGMLTSPKSAGATLAMKAAS